jgi:hypothetical protein
VAEYEYQATTAAGIIRVYKRPNGLWYAQLDGREWIGDFGLPDYAVDYLASYEIPFPEGVKLLGNSETLGLSDNLRDWKKVRVQQGDPKD